MAIRATYTEKSSRIEKYFFTTREQGSLEGTEPTEKH